MKAVDGVDLDFRAGEIHAIAGENGAGKSTLMKLLSQAERPDGGEVERVRFYGPKHAQQLGIAMVHQEFALAPISASPRTSCDGVLAAVKAIREHRKLKSQDTGVVLVTRRNLKQRRVQQMVSPTCAHS